MRWIVLLLLLPSASAVDLFLGYGSDFMLSELQDDPRERTTMNGRSPIGTAPSVLGMGEVLLGDAYPSQGGSPPESVTALPFIYRSDSLHCTPKEDSELTVSLAIMSGPSSWTGNPDHPIYDAYLADVTWELRSGISTLAEGAPQRILGPKNEPVFLNWTVPAPEDPMIQPELQIWLKGIATSFYVGYDNSTANSFLSYECQEEEPTVTTTNAEPPASQASTTEESTAETNELVDKNETKESPAPLGLLALLLMKGKRAP